MSESLPRLFKRDKNGSIREWQILFDETSFWSVTGLVNGKLTVGTPTFVTEKNVGKSNYLNLAQQAKAEAQALWTKKKKGGYVDSLEEAKVKNKFALDSIQVMLAESWAEYGDDHLDMKEDEYFIQPKLDGVRCLGTAEGELFSRNHTRIGIGCYKIQELIKILLDFSELKDRFYLDGELYNHKYKADFPALVSLIRKTDPNEEELKKINDEEEGVQYHIYDLIPITDEAKQLLYSERKEILSRTFSALLLDGHLRRVLTFPLVNYDEVQPYTNKFIDELGFEGAMIRVNKSYQFCRTPFLLKNKRFLTEEFEIVGFHEGKGKRKGTVGKFDIKLPNGKVSSTNVKGEFSYITKLWNNKNLLIGKFVTVKFQEYSPDGVPRFPYVVSIRDYE